MMGKSMRWMTESLKNVAGVVANIDKKMNQNLDQKVSKQPHVKTKNQQPSYEEALKRRNNVSGRYRNISLSTGPRDLLSCACQCIADSSSDIVLNKTVLLLYSECVS